MSIDDLGSVVALSQWNSSTSQVEIVERYVYDAFGKTQILDAGLSVLSASAVGNRNTVKYNHLPSPVWDRYYYDTLNRLWKVEYAQTCGFALAGETSLTKLAVVAAEWMGADLLFVRNSANINEDEKIYTMAEFAESSGHAETLRDENGDIIAQIIYDAEDRIIVFTMYPSVGGRIVIFTFHGDDSKAGYQVYITFDAEGNIVSREEMPLTTASTEKHISISETSVSSVAEIQSLDDGGMMMTMGSPESPAAASEIFLYDHLGNRYQETVKNGFTYTYTHNSVNQYERKETNILGIPIEFDYLHDDNGNLQIDEQWNTYSYDYRNRLTKVEDYESNVIAEYAFDALGRRISKTAGSIKTYFIYDTQGRVIAEYEDESLTKEFVYGNGFNEVVAVFLPQNEGNPEDWEAFMEFVASWLCTDPNDACYNGAYDHNNDSIVNLTDFAYLAGIWDIPSSKETRFYYLHDALGSVRGLIGGRFNREQDREFYNYDVYGKSTDASSVGNPFRFAGYRYDNETRLYHTPHRAYNPETGRWMQPDPIGYADSWNLYEYVMGNPVMYFDPLGLSGQKDCDFPQEPIQTAWPTGPVNPSMDTVRNPNAPLNYSNQGQGPIYIDQLNEGARNKFRHQDSGRFGSRENFRKQATPQTRTVPGPGLGVMIATEFAATQIATFGYTKYVNDLEKMAKKELKRMGVCKLLTQFEARNVVENECRNVDRPTAFRFEWRGGKYSVLVIKHANACWFNIYEHKRKFFFTLMRSHEIIEEVEKVGKCQAHVRDLRNNCK